MPILLVCIVSWYATAIPLYFIEKRSYYRIVYQSSLRCYLPNFHLTVCDFTYLAYTSTQSNTLHPLLFCVNIFRAQYLRKFVLSDTMTSANMPGRKKMRTIKKHYPLKKIVSELPKLKISIHLCMWVGFWNQKVLVPSRLFAIKVFLKGKRYICFYTVYHPVPPTQYRVLRDFNRDDY